MDIQSVPNNTDLYLKNVHRDISSLGILAATIAYFNFEWRYVTLVMFNALDVSGLGSFLIHYDSSVIVKFGRFVPRNRIQVPQFVIFGQSTTEIVTSLLWLNTSYYDISGKYIIVCSEMHTCDERQIFQTLSKLYMVNVVLLKNRPNNKPMVFTYEIVKPGKCKNSEPELLDWVPDCKNSTCFKSIYYEKFSNFYMCPLYISTLEQPPFMYLNKNASNPSGVDGEVIKLVANILNATLVMRTPANGNDLGNYKNNNWTGCLGDVFNSRAHASMCLAPLTSYKYGNFQISFTYHSMDIVWIAKVPDFRPSWQKILHPLKSHIRFILLFMFIGIIFLNTLMKMNICRNMGIFFKIMPIKHNLPFYSWLICLGMPIPRIPDRTLFRILIYTWVWFCFIIRSAYLAALVSSLKQNMYQSRLNTWRDVVRFPAYGGTSSYREYYVNNPQMYDNWTNVKFTETFQILHEILDGRTDFVLALNRDIIKHHLVKHNGSKYLQVIPEKIVRSPTVMYFKKFSVLTDPINEILRAAYEGGFIQHFYSKYLMKDDQIRLKTTKYATDILKMEHLRGCFLILVTGYCLSFIYFLVENICGNLTRRL